MAFLTKKFNRSEVDSLSKKLKFYKIFDTELTIRQDTTDLKKDIDKFNILQEFEKTFIKFKK